MMNTALPAATQDYPLLNLFWTMLWFSLWALWLFLIVRVVIDIFRSHDLNGWGKAGWLAFVIVLPYLGVLVYLIARGDKLSARDTYGADMYGPKATDTQAADNGSARRQPATNGTVDDLTKLAALHDRGVLTDAEFATQKATVLSR
jgi:hypothetical protein